MNKTFTRIFAGALAAASLFALASCGEKKEGDDKGANASTPAPITEAPSVTDEPTAAPTDAPTPEPTETPEPTATPVPWPTDRFGNIPESVEILLLPEYIDPYNGLCVTQKDEGYFIQHWKKGKLVNELLIQDAMMEGIESIGGFYIGEDYKFVVLNKDNGNIVAYCTCEYGDLLIEAMQWTSSSGEGAGIYLKINTNIIIFYILGNSYYEEYTYDEKVDLDISLPGFFYDINTGDCYMMGDEKSLRQVKLN